MSTIKDWFEKYGSDSDRDEFPKFDRVKNPLHTRPDIAAFLLLDKIVPSKLDMVSCASHDQIWLEVEVDELEGKATEEDILTLVRCGVFYDTETDSLSMFV